METQVVHQEPTASEQPRRRALPSSIGGIVGMVVGGLFAAGLGFLIGHGGGKAFHSLQAMPFWAILLCVLGVCFLALALHEMGHLLAGLAVGFRPYLYVVGPVRIDWDDQQRPHLRLHRDLNLYGGLCATLPVDTANLSQRFAIAVLGGPLTSLVCGLLGLALSAAIHPARLPLLFFGSISLALFLCTSIPMPNGAFLTDGARWLQLKRGGPRAERDAATLYLFALTMTDVPPAEWPESVLQAVSNVQDGTIFDATGRYFLYIQALDRKDIPVAGTHIERILQIVTPLSPTMQASYRVEAAWFFAWHRGDIATAQAHLQHVGQNAIGVRASDLLTARAAIALRSGQIAEGRALLAEATKGLTASKSHTSFFSLVRLQEMTEECENAIPSHALQTA